MFCMNCGQPCADGNKFCEHCGAPLLDTTTQPASQPAPQPVQQPVYAQPQAPVTPISDVRYTLKKLATSPLFLAAAIAYSCMVLFTIAAAVAGQSGLLGALDSYLNMALRYGGYSMGELSYALDQLDQVMPFLRGASLGSALVGQIPAILIAVGIWLVFASAVDKSGMPMKTTGLTIIKVITIISLIGSSLLLVVLEGVLIFGTAAAAKYDDSVVVVGVVIVLAVLVLMGLGILMSVKTISTIGTMQRTIQTEQPSDKVSVYVAVICILNAIGAVFGMLGFGSVFSVLSGLCNAVAYICFAIFLFQYRDKMRVLMAGSTPYPVMVSAQPVYTAASQQYVYTPQEPVEERYVTPPTPADEPADATITLTPVAPAMFVPETTVLSPKPVQPALSLTRVRDGGSFAINQPQFRIGRDPATVDYIVSDNTAVGRHHADILEHDGGCFVVDQNSTNHTYLNGQELAPGMEYPLHDGDELTLGDEIFRVSIQ
mgnify:FL=1